MTAALAVEAAGQQGKFFEMHDLLYTEQKNWGEKPTPTPAVFEKYAEQLGLDMEAYKVAVASPEVKASWDPDMEKRKKIVNILSPMLPEYSLTMGGMTSIDITKKGEDKAYGVKRFSEVQGVLFSKILFVGDKLQPGGNDYPVISTGVKTIEVKDPLETQSLIQSWLV